LIVLAFIIRKIIMLGISVLLSSLIIFVVIEIIPGDPALYMLGLNADDETVTALRTELGLDNSATFRYFSWIIGMLQGDFGQSYAYRAPITPIILDRLEVSVPLAALALFLTVLAAFPVAIFAAAKPQKIISRGFMTGSQIGIAIPNFWFAIILVYIFAIVLGWLPSGGFSGWDAGLIAGADLILPAIALALPQAAILARIMRTALAATSSEDYIRTARAKGLSKTKALMRHGLKNAFIPVLTIMGMQFSFLLAGAIIIENVFTLPGIGRLIFQAIEQRDLIMVESVVLLLVIAVITVTFIVDIIIAWIDPRVRHKGVAS
jgi:peptide/nickel transport system permease protein